MITAILIRHAERAVGPVDPSLNARGNQRAKELVRVLGPAGITKIYATQFRRSKETAAPLASHLHLEITVVDADDTAAVIADITSQSRGSRVLAVGHTDTIGEMVEELAGQSISAIPETEFDNLYVCTVSALGDGSVVHLKYGEPS